MLVETWWYRDGQITGVRLSEPAPRLDDRDLALMALVQRSAWKQALEIVLDDDMVTSLHADSVGSTRCRPHTELTCQIHAATRDALNAGRFQLSITGVSRAAGTTTGRFLDLLDRPDTGNGWPMSTPSCPRPTPARCRLRCRVPRSTRARRTSHAAPSSCPTGSPSVSTTPTPPVRSR